MPMVVLQMLHVDTVVSAPLPLQAHLCQLCSLNFIGLHNYLIDLLISVYNVLHVYGKLKCMLVVGPICRSQSWFLWQQFSLGVLQYTVYPIPGGETRELYCGRCTG